MNPLVVAGASSRMQTSLLHRYCGRAPTRTFPVERWGGSWPCTAVAALVALVAVAELMVLAALAALVATTVAESLPRVMMWRCFFPPRGARKRSIPSLPLGSSAGATARCARGVPGFAPCFQGSRRGGALPIRRQRRHRPFFYPAQQMAAEEPDSDGVGGVLALSAFELRARFLAFAANSTVARDSGGTGGAAAGVKNWPGAAVTSTSRRASLSAQAAAAEAAYTKNDSLAATVQLSEAQFRCSAHSAAPPPTLLSSLRAGDGCRSVTKHPV